MRKLSDTTLYRPNDFVSAYEFQGSICCIAKELGEFEGEPNLAQKIRRSKNYAEGIDYDILRGDELRAFKRHVIQGLPNHNDRVRLECASSLTIMYESGVRQFWREQESRTKKTMIKTNKQFEHPKYRDDPDAERRRVWLKKHMFETRVACIEFVGDQYKKLGQKMHDSGLFDENFAIAFEIMGYECKIDDNFTDLKPHAQNRCFLTAAKIAREHGLSTSQVEAFCKELGFEGFIKDVCALDVTLGSNSRAVIKQYYSVKASKAVRDLAIEYGFIEAA